MMQRCGFLVRLDRSCNRHDPCVLCPLRHLQDMTVRGGCRALNPGEKAVGHAKSRSNMKCLGRGVHIVLPLGDTLLVHKQLLIVHKRAQACLEKRTDSGHRDREEEGHRGRYGQQMDIEFDHILQHYSNYYID